MQRPRRSGCPAWKRKERLHPGLPIVLIVDIEGFALGHVEAPANVNEKMLVEPLLDRLLGEDSEVELMTGESQFESSQVFDDLCSKKINGVIPWRRLKERVNPSDALSVKDCIDVEALSILCYLQNAEGEV